MKPPNRPPDYLDSPHRVVLPGKMDHAVFAGVKGFCGITERDGVWYADLSDPGAEGEIKRRVKRP